MAVRVALIGCGELARDYYAPAFRRLAKEGAAVLAACCDCDEDKSRAYAVETGFEKSYSDVKRMIRESGPDCMLIATPVTVTAKTAADLSRFCIPMMIEKPPALNAVDGELLKQALQKNGVLHQIAFNRHYMPLIRELKSRLEVSGDIQNVQVLMSRYRRTEPTFYTTAIHSVDLARYLAGAPYEKVRFSYQSLPQYGGGVENIFMDCRFKNGVSGQVSTLVCSGTVNERVMVTCDDRSYFARLPVWGCSDCPGNLEVYERGLPVSVKSGGEISDGPGDSEMNGFYAEIRGFLQAVEAGRQPEESMEYAMQAVKIGECIHNHMNEFEGD